MFLLRSQLDNRGPPEEGTYEESIFFYRYHTFLFL
jgi:hypothetical protein